MKIFNLKKVAFAALLAVSASQICPAGIIHDESVNGDLSSNQNSPTNLGSRGFGAHSVRGTTTGTTDRDFWTITIPPAHALTSIVLDLYNSTDNQSFFAIRNGTTFPSLTDATQLFGRTFLGNAVGRNQGDDVLDNLAANNTPAFTPATPSNFTAPLGPGTYSFWVQENSGTLNYQFTYNVIPEPSSLLLAGASLGFLVRRRVR
jgi:hypothetical protein